MATQANLIATYNANPTLQSRYTQQQYLDLFGFGAQQPTPDPDPTPGPTPDPNPPGGLPNIIGQDLNRGDGIQSLQQTFTPGAQPKSTYPRGGIGVDELNQKIYNQMGTMRDFKGPFEKYTQEEFMEAMPEYFSQGNPQRKGLLGIKDKVTDFFSGFSTPKVRGTLGTRLANQPMIPLPGALMAYSRSPLNPASGQFNPAFEGQLNYLEGQDGFIGRDQQSGGLKYGPESVLSGQNVISGFGTNDYLGQLNKYENKVTARYDKLVDKFGEESDEATKYYDKFVQKVIDEKKKFTDSAIYKAQQEALAAAAAKAEAERAAQYGATNYGKGADGQQSYSGDAIGAPGLGFGVGATTGGPVSNRTGRGRQDYSDGGRVYLYNRLK